MLYALAFIVGFLLVVTYVENFRAFNRILFPLDAETKKHLAAFYPYYRKLSYRRKRRFEKKVKLFLNSFTYELKGNMRLTPEVRAALGGAAIQISLYLPDECFDYYNTLILYPQPYHSRFTGRMHKGEVNPSAQLIVFSWSSVLEGLQRTHDGLNLLLHEYAHALYFEHKLMGSNYSVFNEEAFQRVMQQGEIEMEKIKAGQPHVLRKYAAASIEEFFAVAIENFFERSALLKKELPELYGALVLLLRQDPLKV
jgi:hypothetical protein